MEVSPELAAGSRVRQPSDANVGVRPRSAAEACPGWSWLDQFDAAVALGNDGRTAHMGATRDLRAVATEIVRTVRVMDGRNRQRFADQEQLLGSWISASTVLGRHARTGAVPEGRRQEGR
jgi:hypothetical protein